MFHLLLPDAFTHRLTHVGALPCLAPAHILGTGLQLDVTALRRPLPVGAGGEELVQQRAAVRHGVTASWSYTSKTQLKQRYASVTQVGSGPKCLQTLGDLSGRGDTNSGKGRDRQVRSSMARQGSMGPDRKRSRWVASQHTGGSADTLLPQQGS